MAFWLSPWSAYGGLCGLFPGKPDLPRQENSFMRNASAWKLNSFVWRPSAKSAAPRCSECTFADDVSYVRNRATGELSAFVEISIPVENSNSEVHNNGDAVGNLQLGTAVFRFDRDHWETDGRAILNKSPSEAIRYYSRNLEKIGEEFAHRS